MNDMTVHEVWQQYDVLPLSDTQLWVRNHDHTYGIFDTATCSFTVPVACRLGKYLTSSLRLLSIGDKCGVYDTKHGRRMLSIGYNTIDDFRETNIVSEGLRPACITNYMPWVQRRELGEAPVQDADDHRHVSSLLFRVRLGARWGVFDPKKTNLSCRSYMTRSPD